MRSGSLDPAVALRVRTDGALLCALERIGADRNAVIEHSQRAWSSNTFGGSRHRLTYGFDGAEAVARAEHFVGVLADHEFNIPGILIADASVVRSDRRTDPPRLVVECELLLLEES